jgi:hypothetical protein
MPPQVSSLKSDLLPLLPKAGWIFGSGWTKLLWYEQDGYLGTSSKHRYIEVFIAISQVGGAQAIVKP